jgi:sigma-B regulation protein RsbU (phosphoserine phosphatase)
MSRSETQILLVEDNPGDVDLVRLRLAEGCSHARVHCVSRLSDALASISDREPTLVLLDLNLPDSHGAETFRRVLKHSPHVPVVVLSGQDDEALAVNAVHHGAQDYLVKGGFSGKQLERSISYAVERQALLRALEATRKEQLEFKNRLLSHVSHELRTPLTCIHQYVSLIADGLSGPTTAEQKDHLRIALPGVSQLQAMIRDLLEASRTESGKLHVEPRCIDVGDLARQVAAMMRPAAQKKNIALEAECDAGLPLVHADPDRILEVLINLIDNAIKFTPAEGSVAVSVRRVEADPETVCVSVRDTGCGITPEAQPLIFERLYQQPGEIDTHNRTGLGLGLFISKELIRLQNGKIWFTSEPGRGSIFTFTLPVYSLAKLLFPVITYKGHLRSAFVLTRVDLTPHAKAPRAKTRDLGQQCLETLRRCIYLDKDLLLPPLGAMGAVETLLVVASTNIECSVIMNTRIREQLERIPGLSAKGALAITTSRVELQPEDATGSLEQQVQAVADRISALVLQCMGTTQKYAKH